MSIKVWIIPNNKIEFVSLVTEYGRKITMKSISKTIDVQACPINGASINSWTEVKPILQTHLFLVCLCVLSTNKYL